MEAPKSGRSRNPEKGGRPVRHRRHSRRSWPPGDAGSHRLQKRLFTPEIKRMLKDWLVRRRDNPYPSRDEKKSLATSSGLTYIQICNWFANWRRKLKNTGREPSKRTWGTLIKNYNTSANGNVEQFSISSNDSIWGEAEQKQQQQQQQQLSQLDNRQQRQPQPQQQQAMLCLQSATGQFHPDYRPAGIVYDVSVPLEAAGSRTIEYYDRFGELVIRTTTTAVDEQLGQQQPQLQPLDAVPRRDSGYFYGYYEPGVEQEQCFQISSTTPIVPHQSFEIIDTAPAHPSPAPSQPTATTTLANAKYKSNIMEKYLRDMQPTAAEAEPLQPVAADEREQPPQNGGRELSKWLESAANFTPDKNNYIEWEGGVRFKEHKYLHQHVRNPSESAASDQSSAANHEREELEAAEALTSLAGNYRQRMFGIAAVRP